MLRGGGVFGGVLGGGVSQVNAALSAIGRYRGVKQLYCRLMLGAQCFQNGQFVCICENNFDNPHTAC